MRIVFMGTPEISATCLRALIDGGCDIALVVTREDKPRGRGNVMTPTPTKALAVEANIPVITPKTLNDPEVIETLREVGADIFAVVAYGKILPREVLDIPRLGCVNLHVSLLPKYRGAAPMQRAIMEGESETGVTVMYMAEGLDTGDIISVEKFPISEEDDFESIHDRSAEVGSKLLLKTLSDIYSGKACRTPQDDSLATYAKKIEKEDARVDFTLDARVASARIRGTTPIPGAYAYLNGKMLKLAGVSYVEGAGKPGEVIEIDGQGDGSFTVAFARGALRVRRVIPEGRGKMTAGDFIRGRKINLGDILS